MKRFMTIAMMAVLAGGLFAEEGDGFLYLGGAGFPFQLSGLTDVDVSDVTYYPLNEGRIYLPMSYANMETNRMWGALIGYEGHLSNLTAIVLEAQVGVGNGDALPVVAANFLVGGKLRLPLGPLAVTGVAKIGYLFGIVNFGEVSTAAGFQSPVILPNATIYNGDTMNANLSGVSYQVGVGGELGLGDSILFVESGVSQAFLSDPKFYVNPADGSDSIEITSDIYETGLYTPADLSGATGSSLGPYLNVGMKWLF